jgi:hypothetical protein
MLDRRTFIKSTLCASALPALTQARGRLAGDERLRVVSNGACGDTRRFVGHCAQPPFTLVAPAQAVSELADDSVQHAFGLTPDSDYFVIAQMAAALGYRVGYHGVHDYRAAQLQHVLTGSPQLVDALAQTFDVAGTDWATHLASAVVAISHDSSRGARVTVCGGSPRPADSGGYLVSWSLHRA